MELWTLLGLISVVIVFLTFINGLGKRIPIMELMLLIAGLQWIVGPFLEYLNPIRHFRYYMYVKEETYMAYVVPAYLIFAGGVLYGLQLIKKDRSFRIELLPKVKNYGLTVFGIGVFFDVISGFLPGTLGFFAFIVANFKFAGAIILFFSEDPKLKKIFYGALIYLFLSALQKAMFHDLILWSLFFYMFWALKHRPSNKQIYLTIILGLLSVSTLQTIKAAYRAKVWSGYQGNKLELFAGLFVDALFLNEMEVNEEEDLNNVRLNQGWIISAIMDEIPSRVPFQKGETVKEAILASILPRFLNPDKKKAGGQENFRKFTGLPLADGTSMGISIIGEAYGNFKVIGGILFMGLWGLFLVWYWKLLLNKIQRNIMFLAFLPIIFLQVVKAETELVVVLNHLIKASIVVFLFFWAVQRFLNWELRHEA